MTKGVWTHIRARLSQERGAATTLVEVLVAIPMMLVVLSAVLNLYQTAARSHSRTYDRAHGLAQQRIGLERMSRELRQAGLVRYNNSHAIEVQTCNPGAACATKRWVRYECGLGKVCVRSQAPDAGGAPGLYTVTGSVVTGLVPGGNFDVFHLTPDNVNPNHVTMTLRTQIKGFRNPIVLQDGVTLRNMTTPA